MENLNIDLNKKLNEATLGELAFFIKNIINGKEDEECDKSQFDEEKEYITKKQLSLKLDISLPTIENYVKRGILQKYKIGHRCLFKTEEINKAINKIPQKFTFR